MNIHLRHTQRLGAIAAATGPREVAALARTVPSLETDELERIVLSAIPPHEWSQP